MMRNTFRAQPKIKVKRPSVRKATWFIGSDGGPCYEVIPSNTIYLSGSSEERNVVVDLIHEINHWGIWGFLTLDEVYESTFGSLNWMLSKAPRPLIEQIADYAGGKSR